MRFFPLCKNSTLVMPISIKKLTETISVQQTATEGFICIMKNSPSLLSQCFSKQRLTMEVCGTLIEHTIKTKEVI